jgi:hypothetical protein
LLDRDPHGNI